MITTIIFDLSEVFLRGLYGTHELLSKRFGITIESSDLHVPETKELFEGRITEDEYWQAILNKHQWSITISELKKIVRQNFKEIEGTREIVKNLKLRGYALGLLSVHAREWIDHCEKEFVFHALFDSVLYSFEVSVCKPDKRAYELILKRLGKKPEECLFIDDNSENVIAAQEFGLQAILFTTALKLNDELKKYVS